MRRRLFFLPMDGLPEPDKAWGVLLSVGLWQSGQWRESPVEAAFFVRTHEWNTILTSGTLCRNHSDPNLKRTTRSRGAGHGSRLPAGCRPDG